jgi:hypothetical protein
VRREYPVVRLDDLGDVINRTQLAALIQRGPKFIEELVTLENKTGVRCLPVEIPGLKGRYTKDAVQRWLKVGIPQVASRKKAA